MSNDIYQVFSVVKTDYYPDMPGCFSYDIEDGENPNSLFIGNFEACCNFRIELEKEWELEDRCYNCEFYEDA